MFVYDFGIKDLTELRYVLFSKKPCPRCGRKLYRVDVLPEFSSGWERDGLKFEYTHRTTDGFRYRCDPCHAYFSLTELVAGT